MDIRSGVLTTLIELLRWDHRKAIAFMQTISERECDDILDHVRNSRQPIVGVAAVVYRVRMRLAGSDRGAKQRAGQEANEHYLLIPKDADRRHQANQAQTESPPRVYAVSPWEHRRREFDSQ